MARFKSQRQVATIFNVSQSTVSYCKAMCKLLESLPKNMVTSEPRRNPYTASKRAVKLDQNTLDVSATIPPQLPH